MNKDNSALLGGCLTVIILLIFAPVITFSVVGLVDGC